MAARYVDSDGDTHINYKMPNGLLQEDVLPGRGLSTKSSTARLAKFGISSSVRKFASENPQTFATIVHNLATKPQTVKAPCVYPGKRATVSAENIYSGYYANAASGKKFSEASSSYTAPSYYLSQCSSESMSQWAGVENPAGTLLIQAGVYADQYSGSLVSGSFYEVVGGNFDTNGLVDPGKAPYVAGDRYYFDTYVFNATSVYFFVQDLDTGATLTTHVYRAIGGAGSYENTIGYFVSERLTEVFPDGSSIRTQYMDHSDVRFRTATVHILPDGTDARMSIEQPTELSMYSFDHLTRLGYSDSLDVTNSNFTEHWQNCGIVE